MSRVIILAHVAAAALLPGFAQGDELSELRNQVLEVQAQNQALQVQLKEQDEIIRELLSKVDGLAGGTASGSDVARDAAQEVESLDSPLVGDDASAPPDLFIRGFADTTYSARTTAEPIPPASNAFGLGELDLLFTSQLADELSVLSEIVFHFDEIEDDSFFEIERIYLKYSPSDLLNVKVGRMHTALGYWNQTFHHGVWFQTTVTRPEILLFEDEGGFLPVHSVGVELSGVKRAGFLDLQYNAAVANGRGESIREVQNVRDLNKSKALNFRLSLSPAETPGFNFGLTAYFDRFPETAGHPETPGETEERIFMGHFVYREHNIELVSEIVNVRHREEISRDTFETIGGYIQGAYELNRWKPYYRFDFVDFDADDPLFSPEQRALRRQTLGTRWDVSTWMALKFEYAYEDRRRFASFHVGAVQAAFSF